MRTIGRFAASCVLLLLSSAAPALARAVTMPTFGETTVVAPDAPIDTPRADLEVGSTLTSAPATALSITALPPLATADDDAAQTTRRPVAFEYSDGYKLRAKIHRYASFATLPLFVAEAALGQSLYNSEITDGKRSAHRAIGTSIGILFVANTVTGAWNLWEGRKDPSAGKKRWVHGLLMIAADVGFLMTANAVPNTHSFEGLLNYEADRSTHRNIAFASMGVATVGYTIMLFGGK